MQVLVALAQSAGQPVSRDDLSALCWDRRIVSADALNRVISKLHALESGVGGGSFRVETLSRVGYRLHGTTQALGPADAAGRLDRRALLVVVAGAAVAASAAGYGAWRYAHRNMFRPLAFLVLPFETAGSDPALALIAGEIAAAIRADLARIGGAAVVAPAGGAASLKTDSAHDLGRRLGADLILAGTVDSEDGRPRIMLTLSDAGNDHEVWSGTAAASAEGNESAVDAAREAVLQAVEGLIRPGGPALARAEGRGDPEAYRRVSQARELLTAIRTWKMRGGKEQAFDAAERADALAHEALAIEPQNAGAFMVLAALTRNGWTRALAAQPLTTEKRAEQSLRFVRRALLADPNDAGALTELGDQYRRFQWRWDEAEALFRRAIARDPGYIDAHWSYSHELAVMGRSVEALDQALTVFRLDPVNPWHTVTLPRSLYLVGLTEAAERRYDVALAAAPDNLFLLYELYYMHLAEGNAVALGSLARRMAALWAGKPTPPGVQALAARAGAAVAALAGRPATLAAIIDADVAAFDGAGAAAAATLQGRARDDLPFIFAIEYSWAGRPGQAVDMLDRALAARSLYWVASLPYGPAVWPAAVRADPRFAELWRRDPRLADLVERRRRAIETAQLAGVRPDGRRVLPALPPELLRQVRAIVAPSAR